jgi:hypothetical protein
MDDNNSRKVNSSKIIKSNKSADEEREDSSSEKPKKKCTICGKWGNYTAENARLRIMTTNSTDQRKQIWRLVGKVNLLLGEFRKLFFKIII